MVILSHEASRSPIASFSHVAWKDGSDQELVVFARTSAWARPYLHDHVEQPVEHRWQVSSMSLAWSHRTQTHICS